MTTSKQRAYDGAVRVVAGHRDRRVFVALRRLAQGWLALDGGFTYNSRANGEDRVLAILAARRLRCVFDVGANVGDWAELALQRAPGATIHAFEIVPELAMQLQRRFAGRPDVRVTTAGLSDHAGEIEVSFYPDAPEMSGAIARHDGLAAVPRTARVTTGDAYCAEHGIDHVDFLKIDVEGAEHQVLDGFAGMLAGQGIDVVQFEYGRANIASHVLLADFHARFDGLGFDVGKIYPGHVDFRPYDERVDEDFRGPNFLAVRRGLDPLREALAGGTR